LFNSLQKAKPASSAAPSVNADVVRPTALRPTTNGGAPHSTALSVADLFGSSEQAGPVTPMPLHHGGSLFERLMSGGTPIGVPPPAHTAQSLERELRGKEKVQFYWFIYLGIVDFLLIVITD